MNESFSEKDVLTNLLASLEGLKYQFQTKEDFLDEYPRAANEFKLFLGEIYENSDSRKSKMMIENRLNHSFAYFISIQYIIDEVISKDIKELLLSFVSKFSEKKLSGIPVGSKSYDLVQKIEISDTLGSWTYDPLQALVQISLKSRGDKSMPSEIEIPYGAFDGKNVEFKKVKEFDSEKSSSNCNNSDLKTVIRRILIENNKTSTNEKVNSLCDKIRELGVETFDDFLHFKEKDFENSSLPLLTKKFIQAEVMKLKAAPALQSKKSSPPTGAEKIGRLHRLKRFLIYETDKSKLDSESLLSMQAIKAGFEETRAEYSGDHLLGQLKVFYENFGIRKNYSTSLELSRGIILYGPPGTGKTTLTDKLPSKVGLTPISHPLCAAEVNRSLVGETEKLLVEMASRANYVPYLQCCVSIDEVDGLAPKRDEKVSSHKNDALAILLSIIGGIKDIPNLIIIASTNRINQIDDAFKRRLSGQFFVGRPSPQARKQILSRAVNTKLDSDMINSIVTLTTNFSGAALKNLITNIITKSYQEGERSLTYEEIIDIASKTSHQFSVKLGRYCLPDLFSSQRKEESALSVPFLKTLEKNKAIVRILQGKSEIEYIKRAQNINPNDKSLDKKTIFGKDQYRLYTDFLEIIKTQSYQIIKTKMFVPDDNINNFSNILSTIKQQFATVTEKAIKNPNITYVQFWDDIISYCSNMSKHFRGPNAEKLKQEGIEIVRAIIKIFQAENPPSNLYNFFITSDASYHILIEKSEWKNYPILNRSQLKYTGRIFIDLSDEIQELRFQTEDHYNSQTIPLHSEPLLLTSRVSESYNVLPKLVEFASEREIEFLILLDLDFLLSNNAYDENKIKESLNEKMSEFENYERSMLVIDVDSIVGVVKSTSLSNMGESNSYNLSDTRLYNMIVNYANNLPKIYKNSRREYWVALIVKNKELSKFIKSDISWPETAIELEIKRQELEDMAERVCLRCNKMYTESDNNIGGCSYHSGWVYETKNFDIIDEKNARALILKENKEQSPGSQKKEKCYYYTCCMQSLGCGGCLSSKHIESREQYEIEKTESMRAALEAKRQHNLKRS